MRLTKFAILPAVALAVVFGAQAATAAPAAHSPQGPRIAAHTLDAAAVKASVAAHHGVLTVTEANRLGVTPNTVYKDTPRTRALAASVQEKSSTGPVMRPDSASGCNDQVCIEVTGTGLEVTKWYTAAYSPDNDDICSYPAFWVDGELDFTGEEICGTLLEAWDDEPEWFDNHTQLCNTWPGVAGRPCETVHD